MFKKLFNYFNKVDYSKLNDFQKTALYFIYSGNIRKA